MRYLLLLALVPLYAHAQFKCLAPDGVTEYRSTPCAADSKPLNKGVVVPGPTAQPSAPSYWQREAARLERREAQERAEWADMQREVEAARQAEIAARQAEAAQRAQEAREREHTTEVVKAIKENTRAVKRAAAVGVAAAATRTMVCTNMGMTSVCN